MMTGEPQARRDARSTRAASSTILKRHYARYTPEMVERICGISPEQIPPGRRHADRELGPRADDRLCYAVGWTQHTAGVQMIRAGAILQLLLGNIGRPGGGIMALRGHASIQGSTDIPTLYDLLPGYLHMPQAREGELDARGLLSTPAAPSAAGGRTSTSTSSRC